MHWEKKICIRITVRGIVSAILAASVAVNLAIVGAVVGADSPTALPTPVIATTIVNTGPGNAFSTTTFIVPTGTPGVPDTLTATSPEETHTLLSSATDPPIWDWCAKKFYWPLYRVLPGDTLFSLARATGSTVAELKTANCLRDDFIYAGQSLYLPRLPERGSTPISTMATMTPTTTYTTTGTETATDTPLPSATSTITPTSTSTNTPAQFLNPSMSCDPPLFVSFSVNVYDPQDISSLVVLLYSREGTVIAELSLGGSQALYSGWTYLSKPYTVYDVNHYVFHASDGMQNTEVSTQYSERSGSCLAQQGYHDQALR